MEFNAKRIMNELNARVETYIADLAARMVRELRGATPKDTTWASHNWYPAIGKMIVLDGDPPEGAESGAMLQARIRLQEQGIENLKRYKLSMGSVYISNSVPYIFALNAGSSRKAPPEFVRQAIIRAIRGM